MESGFGILIDMSETMLAALQAASRPGQKRVLPRARHGFLSGGECAPYVCIQSHSATSVSVPHTGPTDATLDIVVGSETTSIPISTLVAPQHQSTFGVRDGVVVPIAAVSSTPEQQASMRKSVAESAALAMALSAGSRPTKRMKLEQSWGRVSTAATRSAPKRPREPSASRRGDSPAPRQRRESPAPRQRRESPAPRQRRESPAPRRKREFPALTQRDRPRSCSPPHPHAAADGAKPSQRERIERVRQRANRPALGRLQVSKLPTVDAVTQGASLVGGEPLGKQFDERAFAERVLHFQTCKRRAVAQSVTLRNFLRSAQQVAEHVADNTLDAKTYAEWYERNARNAYALYNQYVMSVSMLRSEETYLRTVHQAATCGLLQYHREV
eukprot:TRINITY_DN4501_c0_g1_i1.p1 TRINITY_DN4501_c0_g1~~TRINITY_DN4501_c0_g1_i1.p1  ORF type:complete len:407 (+),score=4.32 TRINITY_DN4501_c0_g1_i1:67-1221(+)